MLFCLLRGKKVAKIHCWRCQDRILNCSLKRSETASGQTCTYSILFYKWRYVLNKIVAVSKRRIGEVCKKPKKSSHPTASIQNYCSSAARSAISASRSAIAPPFKATVYLYIANLVSIANYVFLSLLQQSYFRLYRATNSASPAEQLSPLQSYFRLFRATFASSELLSPLQIYFRLFRATFASSELVSPLQSYFRLFRATSASSELLLPLQSFFRLFRTTSASSELFSPLQSYIRLYWTMFASTEINLQYLYQ